MSARSPIPVLVTLGGAAALSWEILWQLQASLAFGVSALGTAVTLATTMAGMACGSLLAGRWLRGRVPWRPLRVYAGLEGVIGLSGLLMLPGFAALERLDAWVYAAVPELAPAFLAVGIAGLLGVPTLAMGATVPVFARLARGRGSSVAALYGLNTLGAACGTLTIAFFWIRWFGVTHTAWGVACLNLLVFAAGWAWNDGSGPAAQPRAPGPDPTTASAGGVPAWIGLVVFCTGFVTFGLEVAWFRSLRAAFQSVTESFAIMLVAVLIPLGVAARAVPALRRRGVGPEPLLALAGFATLLATPLVERMDLLALRSTDYLAMLLQWSGLCLLTMGPSMLALGAVLPWYLDALGDPPRCARAYALNTLGAVAGSLVAAWALLPAVGFARAAWLLGLVPIGLALLGARGGLRIGVALGGAVGLAVAVSTTSSVGRDRVQGEGFGLLAEQEVLAYREGPDATVSVVAGADGARFLMIDGFTASAEGAAGTDYMEWMGRLPMLAHPDPKRALVICFGTGRTANALREEGPEALDVVELSPAVYAMAHHFESNRKVLDDPRVRSIVMDGRAWLRRTTERYDVVTLEPMPPTFAGVNALYSSEFYEIVARRLAPGGVVAQWVPLHLLPPFHAASVVATFQGVFPDAVLWVGPGSGTGILLGRPTSQAVALGRRWPGLAREREARPPVIERVGRFVVLDPVGLLRYGDLGRPITDDNQRLAYDLLRADLMAYGPRLAEINLRVIRDAARGARVALPNPPEGVGP